MKRGGWGEDRKGEREKRKKEKEEKRKGEEMRVVIDKINGGHPLLNRYGPTINHPATTYRNKEREIERQIDRYIDR